MVPRADYSDFLMGREFRNDFVFELDLEPRDRIYRGRIAHLSDMLRSKRVVHVGFVDHNVALITDKIKRGKWLHQELVKVCARVAGVDILADEVEHIQPKLPNF